MSDLLVCEDCMIVIANADTSGVADDKLQSVMDGIAGLGGYAYVTDDEGFMHYCCDCCHDTLAGDRYGVNVREV